MSEILIRNYILCCVICSYPFVMSILQYNVSFIYLDFTASLKGLLTDPVFLSITLAFVCLTSFLAASVTYVSKYMETQFSLTASFANLLNGNTNMIH